MPLGGAMSAWKCLVFIACLAPSLAFAARVKVSAPRTADKGAAIQFTYEVSGAPRGASIGFFLEKYPADTLSPGPQGALGVKSEDLAVGGKGIFIWDGSSFGCAPTDAPTICATPLEPGQYRMKAQLYNRAGAYLMPLMMPASKSDPKELAHGYSDPFTVTGKIDTSTVESNLLGLAIAQLTRQFELFHFSGTELVRYVDATATLRGPDGKGAYCRTFYYRAPFAGAIEACAPNSYGDEGRRVTGEARTKEGVVPYATARDAAMSLAERPYVTRVKHRRQEDIPRTAHGGKDPEATTYLSVGITNWVYREDGGFWLFVVHVGKAGGSEEGADRFHDLVFMRVNEKGTACLVRAMPYKGGDYGNIFRDAYVCAGGNP